MVRYWYAVQEENDNDWGYGSYNINEAKEMCNSNEEYVRIAVIEEVVESACIKELVKGIDF